MDVAYCSDVVVGCCGEVVDSIDVIDAGTSVCLRSRAIIRVDDGCECDVWVLDRSVCELLPFVLTRGGIDVEGNEDVCEDNHDVCGSEDIK